MPAMPWLTASCIRLWPGRAWIWTACPSWAMSVTVGMGALHSFMCCLLGPRASGHAPARRALLGKCPRPFAEVFRLEQRLGGRIAVLLDVRLGQGVLLEPPANDLQGCPDRHRPVLA